MPTPADVAQAATDARTNYTDIQALTTAQLQEAYFQASADIAKAAQAATPGTLTKSAQANLASVIHDRATSLNDESLAALRSGIRQAYIHSTSGTSVIQSVLASVFGDMPVQTMVQDANERAALAHMVRTGKDGLQLSQRVWGATETWQGTVGKVVQDAVISGKDARKLAKDLAPFVEPGAQTTQHKATARRLGVPANTSYPAMRVARTELQQAFHEGTINGHSQSPSYKGIRWRLSGSHPGTGPNPDICNTLAQGKAGDGSGFWPKGEEPTKPHPQCYCTAIPVHTDPEALLGEAEEWLAKPTANPEVNDWYKQKMVPYLQLSVMPVAGGAVGGGKFPPGWGMGDKVKTYVGNMLHTGTVIGSHSDGSLRIQLDANGTLVWRKPTKLEKVAPPAASIVTPPPPPPPPSLAIDKTTKGAVVYADLHGMERKWVVLGKSSDGYLKLGVPPGVGTYMGLPKSGFVWRKPNAVKLAEAHLQPGGVPAAVPPGAHMVNPVVPVPATPPAAAPLPKVGDTVEVLHMAQYPQYVGMKLPVTDYANGVAKVMTPFDGPLWLAGSQYKVVGTATAVPSPAAPQVGDYVQHNDGNTGVIMTQLGMGQPAHLQTWQVKLQGGAIDYWYKSEVTKVVPTAPAKVGDIVILTSGPYAGKTGMVSHQFDPDHWIIDLGPNNQVGMPKTQVQPIAPAAGPVVPPHPPPPAPTPAPAPPPAPAPAAPPANVANKGTLVVAKVGGQDVVFTSGGVQGGYVKLYPYSALPPGTKVPKSGFFWKVVDKVTAVQPAGPPGAPTAAPAPAAPAHPTPTPHATPAGPVAYPAPPPPGQGRASYAPPPSFDLAKLTSNPDPAELQAIMGVGSAHVAKFKIFTDDNGDHWLFKPQASSTSGLDAATGLLAHRMGFDDAYSETYVVTIGGQEGSIHNMSGSSSKGTRRDAFGPATSAGGGKFDPSRSDTTNFQVQQHAVFNWLISNHDAHKANFVRVSGTGGRLKGIDKGQAFKYFGHDAKLTKDYDPNNNLTYNGGSVYNSLHTAYADPTKQVPGFANLHSGEGNAAQLKAHIQKLQSFSDEEFKAILRPYAEAAAAEGRLGTYQPYQGGPANRTWKNDPEGFLVEAVKRKNSLLKDWTELHKELYEERHPPAPPIPGIPADLPSRLKGMVRGARAFASARSGTQWARPKWQASFNALAYESKSALRNYQGSGYHWMNDGLRARPTTDLAGMQGRADIEAVDKAMAHTRTEEDILVTRGDGQSGDPWRNQGGIHSLVGTVQQQKGFWSTSLDADPAFDKPYILHIRVPKGTPAFFLDLVNTMGERELLLGRGLKYYVHNVEVKPSGRYGGTKTHVYLEVLTPDLQEQFGGAVS